MKLVLLALACLLAVTSAQWDAFLNDFDLDCLKNMMEDQAASDALSHLQDTLNPKASNEQLVNIQALQLSEHVQCVSVFSDTCGTNVQVFPPRSTVSDQVTAITNEINQMSDDQLLQALNYDINGFCASLTQFQTALAPYNNCINTNLNAIRNLPVQIANAVLEYLQQQGSGSSGGAWNFNLTQVLDLSNGCDSFKGQVAASLRSQLTSSYWNDVISGALTAYDSESFENTVNNELDVYNPQCTIPTELACTQTRANFYSVCQLTANQQYDFILMQPIDGQTGPGSASYETYEQFAETTGVYPCSDAFTDSCYSSFLTIPNLDLTSACKSSAYDHGLVGETPNPTAAPTSNNNNPPTASPPSNDNGNTGNDDSSSQNPPSDSGNDNGNNTPSSGLTSGGVAAIVLSILVVFGVAAVGGYFLYKKRGALRQTNYQVQLE